MDFENSAPTQYLEHLRETKGDAFVALVVGFGGIRAIVGGSTIPESEKDHVWHSLAMAMAGSKTYGVPVEAVMASIRTLSDEVASAAIEEGLKDFKGGDYVSPR